MLSTSYEAFYYMECLRSAAGLTIEEVAGVINVAPSYYRTIRTKVSKAEEGSLNTRTDYAVRKGIAYLVYGLANSTWLPIITAGDRRRHINMWLTDCQACVLLGRTDPLRYFKGDEPIEVADLICAARPFSA